MGEQIEKDLADFVSGKIRQILKDACALVDDPGAKARIAIMASSVCIGTGAVYLTLSAGARGEELPEKGATLALMDLLRLNVSDGPDAVVQRMQQSST